MIIRIIFRPGVIVVEMSNVGEARQWNLYDELYEESADQWRALVALLKRLRHQSAARRTGHD